MKKVLVLAVLMTIIESCTAEVECRYNKRGGVENCRYMD